MQTEKNYQYLFFFNFILLLFFFFFALDQKDRTTGSPNHRHAIYRVKRGREKKQTEPNDTQTSSDVFFLLRFECWKEDAVCRMDGDEKVADGRRRWHHIHLHFFAKVDRGSLGCWSWSCWYVRYFIPQQCKDITSTKARVKLLYTRGGDHYDANIWQ